MCVPGGRRAGRVFALVVVLRVLQFFVQAEAEPVLALVANGEVGENEVPSRRWAVQINHAGDRGAGEDDESIRLFLRHAAVGHRTGLFQRGEEEIICVHVEGDIAVGAVAFVDLQLHDGRRIHRPAVCRSCSTISGCREVAGRRRPTFRPGAACPGPLRLLEDVHAVPDLLAILGGARRLASRLIVDGDDRAVLDVLHGGERGSGGRGRGGCVAV